jgi:hypothetical protein
MPVNMISAKEIVMCMLYIAVVAMSNFDVRSAIKVLIKMPLIHSSKTASKFYKILLTAFFLRNYTPAKK